jgi:pyruvate kinase
MKKTKILATIGPASQSRKILRELINSGMDAIRLNTAHGTIDQYEKIIHAVKSIKDIPIIFDLKGPEIRIKTDKDYCLAKGDTIRIGFGSPPGPHFNHRFIVPARQALLINDGLFRLKVISSNKDYILLAAESDLCITNRVRVNIPGLKYSLPILSAEDIKFLEYGKKKKIDYIALSYTRTGSDVKAARERLGDSGIGIIAKIETLEGVKNFDDILAYADGIMVARGDLGVEVPSENLPMIQKEIIRKCNKAGKLVITATQMLQSMIENPVPTRAETSDVANAILDGTDVIMLSGETAAGKYPVLAVKEMTKIALETEKYVESKVQNADTKSISMAISGSIKELTSILPITKIVTLTRFGFTAKIISRFRLKQQIIAITPDNIIRKRLELYYGVLPLVFPDFPTENRIYKCTRFLFRKKYISRNDLILFTAGVFPAQSGSTNMIEIHHASEMIK